MTDPISYTSASPRFGLPFLFAGHAQKEFFVNEALSRIDGLLHVAVEGEAASPPPDPQEGQCWLVAADAAGGWDGQGGMIACRQGGTWLFASPAPGMIVFDKAAGRQARFLSEWTRAAAVTRPEGGTTIDAEARAAITGLASALVTAGILSG